MNARRTRHGWTLLEVLVAAGLITIVLAATFLLFNFSDRSRGVTRTARALQTATFIEENLLNDLSRVVTNGDPFVYDADHKDTIGFYVVDTDHDPADGKLAVNAVRYRLKQKGAYLERELAGKSEAMGISPLESIEFLPFDTPSGTMIRVNLVVGHTPDDPDGPALTHTFLARPALAANTDDLPITATSEFKPKPDKGAPLPAPSGVFPPPSPAH